MESGVLCSLREKNTDINIYPVESEEFLSFGRVIKNMDPTEIIKAAEKIEGPATGSSYVPSEEKLERFSIASQLESECFGTLPSQIGYCWGHNRFLNAAEWHKSNEINIAVTPLVLLLGHIWDISGGIIDASRFQAFYLPKGTVTEIYATSLHFCPCEVQQSGFGCVVALPAGTNTPLEHDAQDRYLFRKNKWLIAHEENTALIERGAVPGISGVNYKIKY